MHTEPPVCSQGNDESAFNEQLCRQLQIPLFEPQPLSDGGPGRDASPERRPRGTTSKSASRAGRTTSWTPQDLRGGDSDCCSRAGSFESASSRRIQERPPPSPPLSGSPGRASRPLRRGASVATSARHIVSGNRRRFIEGGYDLDLSYITSNVIAMAFPGEDFLGPFSSIIRNNIKTVRAFLDERHGGRYRVYNLCREKTYEASRFEGRVRWLPIPDHHPPSLSQLMGFCHSLSRWLNQHPHNVAAVHCRGGKGRTGLLICCWLLYCGHADGEPIETTEAALAHFTARRSDDPAGAPQRPTRSGQLRYLEYFHHALRNPVPVRPIRITAVRLSAAPAVHGAGRFRPAVRVSADGLDVFRSGESRLGKSEDGGDDEDGASGWRNIPAEHGVGVGGRHDAGCGGCFGLGWSRPAAGRLPSESRAFSVLSGSEGAVRLDLSHASVAVCGDFKVEIFNGAPRPEEDDEVLLSEQALCYLCLHTTFLPAVGPARFALIDLDRADPDRSTSHESSGPVPSGSGSPQVAGASSICKRMFPNDFVLELHFDDDVAVTASHDETSCPVYSNGSQLENGHCLDVEGCKRAGSVASIESFGSAELSPVGRLRSQEWTGCGRTGSFESVESESDGLCGGSQTGGLSSARRRRPSFIGGQPLVDLKDQDEPAGGGTSSEEGESLTPEATQFRCRRLASVVFTVADATGTSARAGTGGTQLLSTASSAAAARLQAWLTFEHDVESAFHCLITACAVPTRTYEAGELVVRHGELQDRLVVVETGGLRVVPRARDAAGRQAAAIIGAGGVVGEMSVLFLAAGPQAGDVIAECSSTVWTIGAQEVLDKFDQDPVTLYHALCIKLSDQICPVSSCPSLSSSNTTKTPAGWRRWRPGCFGRIGHPSYSATASNVLLPATEGKFRQRLADELEVPAWEALVLMVGCVSCSRKEGDVGGLWPSGEGELVVFEDTWGFIARGLFGRRRHWRFFRSMVASKPKAAEDGHAIDIVVQSAALGGEKTPLRFVFSDPTAAIAVQRALEPNRPKHGLLLSSSDATPAFSSSANSSDSKEAYSIPYKDNMQALGTRILKSRRAGSGGSIIWTQSKYCPGDLDSCGGGSSCKISSSHSSKLQAAFLEVLGLGQAPTNEEGCCTQQPYAVRAYAPREKIFCHRIGGGAGPRLSLVTEGVAAVKIGDQVLEIVHPGSCFGNLQFIEPGKHAGQGADIYAGRFEGLRAVEVEPDWLWARMTQDQEFAARFYRYMAQDLSLRLHRQLCAQSEPNNAADSHCSDSCC